MNRLSFPTKRIPQFQPRDLVLDPASVDEKLMAHEIAGRIGSFGKFLKRVESCYLLSYYNGKNAPPPAPVPMTPEEEQAAFVRYAKRRSMKDRDLLLRHYLRWSFQMAGKYKGPRLCFDEAISAANEGLVEALEGFDPSLGYRFTTYAAWILRRKLISAILSTYPVRVSDHVRKKIKLEETDPVEQAKKAIGDEPRSLDEFFERLGQSCTDVNIHLLHTRPEDSPFVPSPAEDPATKIENLETNEALKAALAKLDPRSRKIVEARHFRASPASFQTLAKRYNIPKTRAREIYERALSTLRDLIERSE